MAWAASGKMKTYGGITLLPLGVYLPAPAPAPPLAQIDFRNFTYQLFATQATPDASRAGIPEQLEAPVVDGVYNHRNAAADPFEFDVLQVVQADLPHAPDHQAAIVIGTFYAGHGTPVCTGVAQLLERRDQRVEVMDQITFDCRGGLNAHYLEKKRRLRIVSAVFVAGDPHCCPSQSDTVDFKLGGDQIKASVQALASGQ